MTDRLFRFRRWAVAALTGATVLGGVAVVGAGQAGATTAGATAESTGAPFVNAGANNQAAGSWEVNVPNVFVAGDTITFQVTDDSNGSGTGNCSVANEYLGFSGTPTVSVVADSGNGGTGDTVPHITASTSTANSVQNPGGSANCTALGVKDLLTLTISNTASNSVTNPGDSFDVTVSGVSYNVGSADTPGTVGVSFNNGGFDYTAGDATSSTFPSSLDGDVSNATVELVAVTANQPPVGVNLPGSSYTATNAPISPVTITENVPGEVPSGYVCLWISNGTWDVGSGNPTITASGGGSAVDTTLTAVPSGQSGHALVFDVSTASSTAPATYTISKLHIDNNDTAGPDPLFVYTSSNAGCTTGSQLAETPPAYNATATDRLFGATVDQTAATIEDNTTGCKDNMVLARNDAPFDALAGSFLAGELDTGTLLTDPNSLSSAAATALRNEGVTTVYVLGGPLAISDAVVSQIEGMLAYTCGGSTPVGGGATIQVIRIYGQTADGTAAAVAQYFGAVGTTLNLGGAYGMYNNTTGAESASGPDSNVNTAILAADSGWQDATSAGAAAWLMDIPVLLTSGNSLSTDAQNALVNLAIQQVVVMGGPLAIPDSVVTQLEGMGITVLRVAGQDYTDTSQLFAQFYENQDSNSLGDEGIGGVDNNDDWETDIAIARGDYFGDSLAASSISDWDYQMPILLTVDPNTLGSALTGFLNKAGTSAGFVSDNGRTNYITVLGGNAAVSSTTLQNALDALSAGANLG